jgi:hypothetical protein
MRSKLPEFPEAQFTIPENRITVLGTSYTLFTRGQTLAAAQAERDGHTALIRRACVLCHNPILDEPQSPSRGACPVCAEWATKEAGEEAPQPPTYPRLSLRGEPYIVLPEESRLAAMNTQSKGKKVFIQRGCPICSSLILDDPKSPSRGACPVCLKRINEEAGVRL